MQPLSIRNHYHNLGDYFMSQNLVSKCHKKSWFDWQHMGIRRFEEQIIRILQNSKGEQERKVRRGCPILWDTMSRLTPVLPSCDNSLFTKLAIFIYLFFDVASAPTSSSRLRLTELNYIELNWSEVKGIELESMTLGIYIIFLC